MAHEGVEITPKDLRIKFALNKQLLGSISLNNTTDSRIAFKIKTTAPKKYVVRPSSGVVDAKGSVAVQAIMQAQKDYPPDLQNCKDKFMVQTIILPDGEEIDKDTFNKDVKKDELKESRLRVVLEGPAAPPSPVREDDEEPARAADRDSDAQRRKAAAATSHENSSLKVKIDKLNAECESMRRQLSQATQGSGGSTATAQKFSISLIHIILVAIVAFLIGHYL